MNAEWSRKLETGELKKFTEPVFDLNLGRICDDGAYNGIINY